MKRLRRAWRALAVAGLVVGVGIALLVVLNVVGTLVRIAQVVALGVALVLAVYVAYELYTGWNEAGPDARAERDRGEGDEDAVDDERLQREIDEELADLSREVAGRETEKETE